MGTSRQNITMINYRKSIQVDLLAKFCTALNYDFFQHYALLKNEEIKKQMQSIIDEKQKEIETLSEKVKALEKTMEEKLFVIDVLRGKK